MTRQHANDPPHSARAVLCYEKAAVERAASAVRRMQIRSAAFSFLRPAFHVPRLPRRRRVARKPGRGILRAGCPGRFNEAQVDWFSRELDKLLVEIARRDACLTSVTPGLPTKKTPPAPCIQTRPRGSLLFGSRERNVTLRPSVSPPPDGPPETSTSANRGSAIWKVMVESLANSGSGVPGTFPSLPSHNWNMSIFAFSFCRPLNKTLRRLTVVSSSRIVGVGIGRNSQLLVPNSCSNEVPKPFAR